MTIINNEICSACGLCNGTKCLALEKDLKKRLEILPDKVPETYGNGVRFTADAMDCALPIAMDSHSGCSFMCLYCFANSLLRSPDRNLKTLKKNIKSGSFYSEWPISKLEKFLDRELKGEKYFAMYPLLDSGLPIQLGALGDPCDDIEEISGWLKKAIPLFIKYKIPVRISTKGARVLLKKDYISLFEKSPEQFWIAFSCISNSDELISKVDIGAPVTSERLKAMKTYTDIGCHASLRFRPFLPGISDSYKGEPEAWKVLLERAKKSGARAVSFEFIFLEKVPSERQKAMYKLMFRAQQNPKFGEFWNEISLSAESCKRGTREYKFEMTHKIRDKSHELGLTFGCSDPHFKELNDYGNCCGLPIKDKWFGNWSRRQLTNVVVEGKKKKNFEVTYFDWAPLWAHQINVNSCFSQRNWHKNRINKNKTFGDWMREVWNNPSKARSPFSYFAGILLPIGVEKINGDIVYKYNEWEYGDNIKKAVLKSSK